MTLSLWLDKPSNKDKLEVDVAIIGGGIVGAGCAYWLSQRKNIKAALFDSGQIAAGASGRNAGFLLRGMHSYYNQAIKEYGRQISKEVFCFTEENQRLIAEFAEKHGNSFEYDRSGSYLLACSVEELQNLDESAQLMLEDDFEVTYLKSDPLERSYYGALLNPGDGGLHPAKFVRAVAEVSGIAIYDNEPVIRIDSNKELGLSLITPKRLVNCQKILLCTNAYAPLLESWFADKVRPVRGQILVTKPLKKKVLDKVCYANYGWEYFRQLPDNRFLLGGCRESHIEEEVGYTDQVTPQLQASLEDYLKHRFPEAAGAQIDYRWSGIMGFSDDSLPIVGEMPNIAGVYYAVACNGHGMGYGINMSKLLTEVALDGKDPGPFSAKRLLTRCT